MLDMHEVISSTLIVSTKKSESIRFRIFYVIFAEDNIMNDDVSTKNAIIKAKALKVLQTILCFLIGLAVVLGVKSCIRNVGMPDDFKEAKKLLKKEGFSKIRYLDDEDKIDDLFDELDVDGDGVREVLAAYNNDSEDFFFVLYCDDVSCAKEVLDEFSWALAMDDILYHRGYAVEISYRTVYFGHEDLISELIR